MPIPLPSDAELDDAVQNIFKEAPPERREHIRKLVYAARMIAAECDTLGMLHDVHSVTLMSCNAASIDAPGVDPAVTMAKLHIAGKLNDAVSRVGYLAHFHDRIEPAAAELAREGL